MLQKIEDQNLALHTPKEVVKMATEQANALADIVEEKKLYTVISGKKYLLAEAWETIGAFNSVHAVPEYVRALIEGDDTIGYEAKVNLMKHGEIVGAGIMTCGFEEFPCQGKQGMAKHKAAMSAAQTWATSKAYRLNFSYVVVLAGFQPTPAEEMDEVGGGSSSRGKYHCKEHDTLWFKKGKMKGYAHPLGDNEPWCDMGERELANNAAGPQDPNGTLIDMGDVMRRASVEFDLKLNDVLFILEVEDTLVNWNGTPDQAWESIQAHMAQQNAAPTEEPGDGGHTAR